jgi:hypothetical protein
MRRSAVRVIVLALCAAALPAGASALEWTSRVGVLYGRQDTWVSGGPSTSGPQLDLDLGLDLTGSLYQPGAFDYIAGIGYRRVTNDFGQRSEDRDALSYRFLGHLFGAARSPLKLDLQASRSDQDASAAGTSSTTVATRYGVAAAWQDPGRPNLRGSWARDDVKQVIPLVGQVDRKFDEFNAATGFGGPAFSYGAKYRAILSEGTGDGDNYAEHRADLDASAKVSPDASLTLQNAFLLRLPTTTSAFNVRQELESLTADLRAGREPSSHVATYQYTHASTTVSGTDQRRSFQRVAYGYQRALAPEWRLRLTAAGSYNEETVLGELERAAGQSLEPLLAWRREREGTYTEIHGGPVVGVLEPEGGDVRPGYGGTAGFQFGRPVGNFEGQLGYDVRFRSDLDGQRGWSVVQQLVGGARGRLGVGTVRGQLVASADRRQDDARGSGATRSVVGTAGYDWSRNQLALQLGVQDGTAGALQNVSGDGFFIRAPFQSHSRYVTASASSQPFRHLGGRVAYRYTSTDAPDRPSYTQQEATAALDLSYGALRLSLEDRYSLTDTATGSVRDNQVFLRAARVFGSRY